MKLDAALGTEGNYLKGIDRTARAAEDLGFAGLWTSEARHDGFLPLAIAANETGEMELGTSVAIAFSRSPMETAQTAWDLQDLSEGRFLLGLGTQVKAHITRRSPCHGTGPPRGYASTSWPCAPSGSRSRPKDDLSSRENSTLTPS